LYGLDVAVDVDVEDADEPYIDVVDDPDVDIVVGVA
jgi:hypothetical protein